jgi:hypothetical protein
LKGIEGVIGNCGNKVGIPETYSIYSLYEVELEAEIAVPIDEFRNSYNFLQKQKILTGSPKTRVGKRNVTEKTVIFRNETKRNGTEKNYKIKKRNETESHRK